MAKCQWETYTTSGTGAAGSGYYRTVAHMEVRVRCATHDWDAPGGGITVDSLCPIGRIEEATEAALAQIRRETP
jgi:hypothetical protein